VIVPALRAAVQIVHPEHRPPHRRTNLQPRTHARVGPHSSGSARIRLMPLVPLLPPREALPRAFQ
jgi:hypothetical protein